MGTVLECINLGKRYGKKVALEDMNMKIESGKIVGVLGPNASGKTTFIKLANGLLTPSSGKIFIDGHEPSVYTKEVVAYLPDKNYLNDWMKVSELVEFFKDFYSNFRADRAYEMLENLNIDKNERLKTLSKGTKEKIQLILVMSRDAKLYMLDEPIAGVDPAARDYIIKTIINNYNKDATVMICTHLIADIEPILDDVVFIKNGNLALISSVDEIRQQHGRSVDEHFREVFKC